MKKIRNIHQSIFRKTATKHISPKQIKYFLKSIAAIYLKKELNLFNVFNNVNILYNFNVLLKINHTNVLFNHLCNSLIKKKRMSKKILLEQEILLKEHIDNLCFILGENLFYKIKGEWFSYYGFVKIFNPKNRTFTNDISDVLEEFYNNFYSVEKKNVKIKHPLPVILIQLLETSSIFVKIKKNIGLDIEK